MASEWKNFVASSPFKKKPTISTMALHILSRRKTSGMRISFMSTPVDQDQMMEDEASLLTLCVWKDTIS